MRSLIAKGAVAASVVAIGGTMAVWTTSAQAGDTGRSRVLDLNVRNDQYAFVDLGAPGASVGDRYVFSDTLSGDADGEDGGSCEIVRVDGAKITTSCVISLRLPRGALTVQALWVRGTGPLTMAVTGGTGDYRDARGELVATDIQTPHEAYRLRVLAG
ncbi:allene oxide cyclase barrel-like domain-containing protein [Actinomadura chibensis]|uniref:Allene oxide cyclase barrel-like domain-containing protein n=1 Tax=Actinomadura chibensis TaxID=392828 RepID=A0A5D0NA12_9ACTN|nr:hypothetical protein [Actinomadura chibensis]TYB41075.1 hypothetical protein FXF69_36745 [Actinomadura chibensis]